MRTNKQQTNTHIPEASLTKRIKHITAKAQDSYIGDIAGGAALMVILIAGLHIPGFF